MINVQSFRYPLQALIFYISRVHYLVSNINPEKRPESIKGIIKCFVADKMMVRFKFFLYKQPYEI